MGIRRRWPLRIALIAVLLLAAPVILPIPVPLDSARARIEAAASAALGHDVRIGGARLTTGLTPTLRLRGVRVSGRPAIDAHAGSVETKFLLLPLLAGELRLVEIETGDVTIEITPSAWPASAPAAGGPGIGLRVTGPQRATLTRAAATIRPDGGAAPLQLDIDEAYAVAAAGGRLQVRASGQFRELPANLRLDTASIEQLVRAHARIPFDLALELAGARAVAAGQWDARAGELEATVSIDAAKPEQLARDLLGLALAPGTALTLKAGLKASANRVAASNARVVLGENIVEGSAAFDASGERPHLTVDAHAQVLDHRTLAERTQAGFELPPWLATWLALPRIGDADIKIRVDRLLTPLVEIRAGRFATRARDGVLTSHGEATIDDVPLRSETRIDATGAAPSIHVRSHAANVPLAQLTQRLGRPELSGVAGKVSFNLDAAGATADALLSGFKLKIDAAQVRVAERAPPRREVAQLRSLQVDAAGSGASRVRADGVFQGDRFTLDAGTEALGRLLAGEPSPVRATLALASARATASGELAHGPQGTRGTVKVEAGARPIGPLHHFLPVNPASVLNASVAGAVAFTEAGTEIRADALRVGSTAGHGRVALPGPGSGAPPRLELALEQLDVDELRRALPASSPTRSAPPPDLAFDVTARKVRYGGQRIDEVRASGELRGGRLGSAPYSARVRGTNLAGTVAADLREAETWLDLNATAQPLDLGALLALAGAPGYEGSATRATLQAKLHGASGLDLLRNATAEVAIERASLALPEYFTPKTLDFSAQAKVAPGQPLTATLEGSAGGTAVEATARLDDPGALLAESPASPFLVELKGAATSARFSGKLGDARGGLTLEGRNLEDLAPLLDVAPPELGPYRVEADLAWAGTRLEAPRFAVKLGESRADGTFTVDWGGKRPRVQLSLVAPRVRFEDIGVKDPRRGGRAAPAPAGESTAPDRATRLAAWRAFLRAYDGEVRIDAQRVESGGELLGRGLYQERRTNGHVEVSPLLVEAEGARLTVTGDIEAAADGEPRYELRASLENFDLAALARRAGPQGRGFGTLDARAQLTSRGLPDEFALNASGPIEVMFIGEDLSSGGLDLMTTGLLRLVANTLHGERGSRVNCAVGDFVMTDGVLESQAFFIDTTRSRVAGDIRADLRTRELSGLLQPRAKRPQLFSVATPVTIGGTIDEPRVSVSPVGIATSTLRLYLFAPTLALDWLNARGLPEDGTPACRDAFRKLAD